MKKVFVEPEMQRIELNLQENIAVSTEASMGYYFYVSLFTCEIQTTGKKLSEGVTEKEAAACLVTRALRSLGMIIPREDVLPYFRR